MSPYPIVAEHTLGPIRTRFWRSARRDPSELPARTANTDQVAVIDGAFERLPSQVHGTERAFVEASSIVIVDMDPYHHVQVLLALASATEGELFPVTITFSCAVRDAAKAAQQAPRDIEPVLYSYLNKDAKLMEAGQGFGFGDETRLRRFVISRTTALFRGRRSPVAAVAVEFASVEVEVPRSLIDFADERRRQRQRRELERMEQEFERMKSEFTLREAAMVEEVLRRGPEAIHALALKLDQRRYDEATQRSYGDRERREDRLMELAARLADHGHLDTIPVDTERLIDQLIDSIAGPGGGRQRADETLSAAEADDARTLASTEAASDDDIDAERPPEPPDEEALVG